MPHWELLSDRDIFSNFVLRLHLEGVRTPAGMQAEWTVVDVVDGAAVLPLAAGGIHLIRQYRHTVGAAIWELPAGRVEAEETPEAAAERELREEAGFDCRSLRFLTTVFPLSGIVRHRVHLYAAEALVNVAPRLEPFEEIVTQWFSRPAIRQMMLAGEIQCGIALAGLSRWLLETESDRAP